MPRSSNYTDEEVIKVIKDYVAYTGGTILLNASKIARYASEEKGLKNFTYYTINRKPKCLDYLNELNRQIKEDPNMKIDNICVLFEPLDVEKYLKMPKERLRSSLSNVNKQLEIIIDGNVSLKKQNTDLKLLVKDKDLQISKIQKELNLQKELVSSENNKVKEELELLKNKVRELNLKNEEKEAILHILWDAEVETVLKTEGILDNDGAKIDERRITVDADKEDKSVQKDAAMIEKKTNNISNAFLEKLKKL